MYKTDERGKYRVDRTWITAHDGGYYVDYFIVEELRIYEDGSSRVHYSEAIHINENQELAFAHKMYIAAQKELFAAFEKKKRES